MRIYSRILALVAFAGLSAGHVYGQATLDPKLTGTYIGAVTGHTTDNGNIRIGGVLFAFSMNYVASLGYHNASAAQGVLFFQGKKYPITFDAAVPPFTSALGSASGKGGPKNRDLDFLMRSNISLFNVRSWWFYGTLPFRREKGNYFTRNRTAYKATSADFGVGGNGSIPYVEFDDGSLDFSSDAFFVEAVRVSTVVGIPANRATRVKVDR